MSGLKHFTPAQNGNSSCSLVAGCCNERWQCLIWRWKWKWVKGRRFVLWDSHTNLEEIKREDSKTSHILSAQYQAQQHDKRFLLFLYTSVVSAKKSVRGWTPRNHQEPAPTHLCCTSPSLQSSNIGVARQTWQTLAPWITAAGGTRTSLSLLTIRWPKGKAENNYIVSSHFSPTSFCSNSFHKMTIKWLLRLFGGD